MDGFKLLEIIRRYDCNLPVIVYSSREFSVDEIRKLREYSESIVLKTAESEARLLDEATLFLHRLSKNLNENQKRMLQQSLQEEIHFNGKKLLMVDDDIRNIFSMTTLLEDYGLGITPAYNGKEAVELIKKESFDIILMDIMMPVMDGYDAIKEIRKENSYKNTPIIALTAKSQKDEKSRCLNAGANDYMSKPVDPDELVRLIKIWLK